ncbi:GNAT family N-acetyltransferase [Arenibaculum pallidiluteum]|uniref:GNAT family N-acetyltransferase n=1 Tax=Arenibaculum pallidiluteum TaxID=2812559 RepID=UPI001A96C405|nr:GNAT family N-acetyltransferase [Arenibaculum pallidiluteum]
MDRLETDRLLLRRPRLRDAAELLAFLGDPEAMRYTQCLSSLREVRRHLAAHDRQRGRLGYGPWTVLTKTDGRIVGFGGLYLDPFDPGWGTELGYHFAPEAWGKGFASELARASLDLAWGQLGLREIWAFAHPDNTASRRVLEKAGFEVQRFVDSMHRNLFRIADPRSQHGGERCTC